MSRRLLIVVIFGTLFLIACKPQSVSVSEECQVVEPGQSWESLAEEFGLDTDNERRGLLVVNILADSNGEVYPGAVVCLDKEQREYVSGDSQIADPMTKVRSDGTTVKIVEKPELVTDKKIVGSQLGEDDPFDSVQLVPEDSEPPPPEETCQSTPDDEGLMEGDLDPPVSVDDCLSSENDSSPGSGDDEIEDDDSSPGSGDDIKETTDTASEAP